MNFIKAITGMFGSSDSLDKVLVTAADGIYNGLDKLIYTDEEKADVMAKGRELFIEFAKIANDQNSTRSITRRWLAFLVMGPIMFIVMLSVLFHGLGMFFFENTDGANAAIVYADFLFSIVGEIGLWGAGVLAFYFGPHLLGSLKK